MIPFWLEDISILYNPKYIFDLIPRAPYQFDRNLNIIARFSIYYSIIYFLIYQNKDIFCLPFITLIVTAFIHKYNYSNNISTINHKMKKYDKKRDKPNIDNYKIDTELNTTLNSMNLIDTNITDTIDDKRYPTIDNPFMNINL